jgi:hypothetical protein
MLIGGLFATPAENVGLAERLRRSGHDLQLAVDFLESLKEGHRLHVKERDQMRTTGGLRIGSDVALQPKTSAVFRFLLPQSM